MAYQYLNLSIRAPQRLAILKKSACTEKWGRPMSWRDVRFARFTSSPDIGQGFNDKTPIWYCHPCRHGYFKREKFAHEIVSLRHTGYYTDADCDELAKGVVVSLPHGKFIAGYYWSENDERVYYPDLYDCAEDAAHAADSLAGSFAETSREDSYKYRETRRLEMAIEDDISELEKLLEIRNLPCKKWSTHPRKLIKGLIEKIRDKRETLKRDYGDYL